MGGCLCGLNCSEKVPFFYVHKGLYMQVTTGPRLLMSQVISLECLVHLPRGSLQHRNVLSSMTTPRDLRRRAPAHESPGNVMLRTLRHQQLPTCPAELLCSQPTPKNTLSKSAYW